MTRPSAALRLAVALGALAAPLLAFAPAARAQGDFSGQWRSNQGAMRLQQHHGRVWGEYELKDGRIQGHVEGETLTGLWAQSSANHRCFEERMGTAYWGRFWFRLNRDGERFHGRWSYCADEPGSGGDWTGERD